VVAFLLLFGYGFLFSGIFNVGKIEVLGAETLDEKELEGFVGSLLSKKLWGIFPKNHPLFINEKLLEASLESEFPKISQVKFQYRYANDTLRITIQERKAIAYWCQDGHHCFLIDSKGVIYEDALGDAFSGNLILRIKDETGRQLRKGSRPFSEEGMMLMLDLKEGLKPEVSINAFVLEPESLGAHYLRAETSAGWYFFADTRTASGDLILKLKTLLAKEIGTKVNRLEYVDLRVPNRAYYKLR